MESQLKKYESCIHYSEALFCPTEKHYMWTFGKDQSVLFTKVRLWTNSLKINMFYK